MTRTIEPATASPPGDGTGYDPIEDRLRETVRTGIGTMVGEELAGFPGRLRHDRAEGRQKGCRHGHRARQLAGTSGTGTVRVPRARIEDGAGTTTEWRPRALPRYRRLTEKAAALIASIHPAGTSTRRVVRRNRGPGGAA